MVIWDEVTTRADIRQAVDAVADMWHADKTLVLLAAEPITTRLLHLPKDYGFRTVLLRKENGLVHW